MKTKEELNALKKEVEALNKKLAELTDDELLLVVGGDGHNFGGEKGDEGLPDGQVITSGPVSTSWQFFD
ncbi:MAG: BREX-1 system adenine-specific DNA-methyltransferase PglX [Clostridia bacterium]|nr:BREX-1 system adenine-specific DNA-methyltransferase PglX [Clostridia bacterium]